MVKKSFDGKGLRIKCIIDTLLCNDILIYGHCILGRGLNNPFSEGQARIKKTHSC